MEACCDAFIDILSAGLDSGVAISAILIFFCLQYPKDNTIGENTIAKWWGNTVSVNTADASSAALLPVPDIGFFGYVHFVHGAYMRMADASFRRPKHW